MKKRYWLRGGLIILIIPALVGVVDFFACDMGRGAEFCMLFSVIASMPIWAVTLGEFSFLPFVYKDGWVGIVLWIVLYLIMYFLVGAFFGWLYGKMRNRKSNSISKN